MALLLKLIDFFEILADGKMIIIIVHKKTSNLIFSLFVYNFFGFVHDFMKKLTTWIDELHLFFLHFLWLWVLKIFNKLKDVRFCPLDLAFYPILIIHMNCQRA